MGDKPIRLSSHLQWRMRVREIPPDVLLDVFQSATERYRDTIKNSLVAIKEATYRGRQREMMVAYRETDDAIVLRTIHPLRQKQKASNIARGRWVSL